MKRGVKQPGVEMTVTRQQLIDGSTDQQVRSAFERLPEAFILRFAVNAEGKRSFTTSGIWTDPDKTDTDSE